MVIFLIYSPAWQSRAAATQGERAPAPLENPQAQSARGRPWGITEWPVLWDNTDTVFLTSYT
jgi:hypothetical protein